MAEIELPIHGHSEAENKSFSRQVALTTAVYAVVLAVSSLGGNYVMKEMLMAQQQASDQWAFYQAKVAREHLYRIEAMRIEADLAERSKTMSPEAKAKFEALRAKFDEETKRYAVEKEEIKKKAEDHEHERNRYRVKDPNFDLSEALLQIAIVLASISILAASRWLYVVSIIFAALGGLFSVNGYCLLFRLPFF